MISLGDQIISSTILQDVSNIFQKSQTKWDKFTQSKLDFNSNWKSSLQSGVFESFYFFFFWYSFPLWFWGGRHDIFLKSWKL